jgi:hypothetical protein
VFGVRTPPNQKEEDMNTLNWYLGIATALASVGLAGCGPQGVGENGASGSTEQAWSSASCGAVVAAASRTGQIDPALTSPQTYNQCTKSYVVDLNNLSADYAGNGAGGGPPATIYASWGDTLPTTQAACEDLEGGAIFYKKVGSSWVDQTGQLYSTGTWIPAGFFAAHCEPPGASFSGLVAGTSYRIAGTMRQQSGTNPTRKVSFLTTKPVVIR